MEPRRPVEEGRQGEVGGVVLRLGVQAHLRLHLPDLLHVHHFYGSDGCLAEPEGSEREGGGKTLAERGRGEESRGGEEREQRRELEKRRHGEDTGRRDGKIFFILI